MYYLRVLIAMLVSQVSPETDRVVELDPNLILNYAMIGHGTCLNSYIREAISRFKLNGFLIQSPISTQLRSRESLPNGIRTVGS